MQPAMVFRKGPEDCAQAQGKTQTGLSELFSNPEKDRSGPADLRDGTVGERSGWALCGDLRLHEGATRGKMGGHRGPVCRQLYLALRRIPFQLSVLPR